MNILFLFIGLIIGFVIAYFFILNKFSHRLSSAASVPDTDDENSIDFDDTAEPNDAFWKQFHALGKRVDDFYDESPNPQALLNNTEFQKAVRLLNEKLSPQQELIDLAVGHSPHIACIACEALIEANFEKYHFEPLINNLSECNTWELFYTIRLLTAKGDSSILQDVFLKAQNSWANNPIVIQSFQNLIQQLLQDAPEPSFGNGLEDLDELKIQSIEQFIAKLDLPALKTLADEIKQWRIQKIDKTFLKTCGRLLEPISTEKIIRHSKLKTDFDNALDRLKMSPPRSILLAGDPGVGKTVLADLICEHFQQEGWTIFESGAMELLAGQKYIGQLEERLQQMFDNIDAHKKIIWRIPRLEELLFAGRHQYNSTSILDQVLPLLEHGKIIAVAEASTEAYHQIIQAKPHIRTALDTIDVHPTDQKTTQEIALQWLKHEYTELSIEIEPAVFKEALDLTQQYLNAEALPGSLIHLLQLTCSRLCVAGNEPTSINANELLTTLSQMTGLPQSVLDEKQHLDIEALKACFQDRVKGQPEVINCLIERVAMLKAGLTDPTRPTGVFLFVGPSGTGKTEVAKTLAEFIFASTDRMIRLDMSEFQEYGSMAKILGESTEVSNSTSLVHQIRKQPFSVVLLDEFEKAHPKIWDLFLQVFDDGHLTDSRGQRVDFKHCIIIMTSNIGASEELAPTLGFNNQQLNFDSSGITKAVAKTFRPEFINRIDRINVFNPLSRKVMREILYKELNDLLNRRGFRNRQWAVEWANSAIDFLLEKGFSPTLGARPLKRAIDQYLLSPLALTIVNHEFPQGDQFLLVRSDTEKLVVEFIDPDATQLQAEAVPAPTLTSSDLFTENIVFNALGTPQEFYHLEREALALSALVETSNWEEEKEQAYTATSQEDFWSCPERYTVLEKIETIDRIESGIERANSIIQRFQNNKNKANLPNDLLQRLAQQIYLLNAAQYSLNNDLPQDAILCIQAKHDGQTSKELPLQFAQKLFEMYAQWAKKRRMKLEVVYHQDKPNAEGTVFKTIAYLSGFGCYSILKGETGLHIWEEIIENSQNFKRVAVNVTIMPQPNYPIHDNATKIRCAEEQLAAFSKTPQAVRNYREFPSPLVRDNVKQWRSGNLGRVLNGNFDVVLKS